MTANQNEDSTRLDWLMVKLGGNVTRALIGVMSNTRNPSEFRARIDIARGKEGAHSMTTTPKTPAQRQAARKARELAAGRVQWKRWVHPDDVPALAELADKLAKKRAKQKCLQSP